MTTKTELRHLLELAAVACGAQIEPCVCSSQPFRFKATGGHWNPEQMEKATEAWNTMERAGDEVAV